MSNLMLRLDGERIILRQRRMHWAFFILPAISGLLLSFPIFLAYLFLSKVSESGDSHLPQSITFSFLALSFAPVILFGLLALGTYVRSRTALTNERFAYAAGLLFHRSEEIFLENFTHVSTYQSFPARYLNYGTIILNRCDGTCLRFQFIHSPDAFKSQFDSALAARHTTLLRQSTASQSSTGNSQ